jgi:hypothetical protein
VAGVTFAAEHQGPLFILGCGSNLLVSDAGFPGLVLRIALHGIGMVPLLSVSRHALWRVAHCG